MAKARFSGSLQRHVAHVLAARGPSSLMEIRKIVGADKGNLLKCLQRLDADRLVDGVGTGDSAAPGQAAKLWSLTDAGRRALDAAPQDVGRLTDGTRCVCATFSTEQGVGIDDALHNGDLVAGCMWTARVDGDGRVYVFAFDPLAGPQPAETLVRALALLGAQCTVGTVSSVQGTSAFLDVLRTAVAVAGNAVQRAVPGDSD